MIPLHDDNPSRLTPVVSRALIAACVLVFLWQLSLGAAQESAIFALGFVPSAFFGSAHLSPDIALVPPAATLVTSMFLHGGFMHLIGNMLYLWIFGDNIEEMLGHTRFLLFYLLAGVAAALTQGLADPGSTVPMVGASGAIAGVLGAYIVMYPHARVLSLVPLGFFMQMIWIPAWVLLGLWFLLQFVSATFAGEQPGGGVAFWAHIGGFVAGIALLFLMRPGALQAARRYRSGSARFGGPWGTPMRWDRDPRKSKRRPDLKRRGPWGDRR